MTNAAKAHKARDFSKSLPMMLLRSREAVMRYFRPSLREHNLTEQQWRVLRALGHGGSTRASKLAHATFLMAPSLSRILRDLEKRKLIGRSSVKKDLRGTVVTLSPAGLRMIAAVAPASESGYAEISRRFGQNRLSELQKMLQQLDASLLKVFPANEREADSQKKLRVHRSRRK